MNICENIITTSQLVPDHAALVFEDRVYTYTQLESASGRAAAILQSCGVRRGDRVGLMLANVPAFVVWYYASLRLGAIVVSVNTRLTGEEAAFILQDCQARLLVGSEALVDVVRPRMPACVEQIVTSSDDAELYDQRPLAESPTIGRGVFENMEPDEPATILYTSGTTGFPKGATLSHRNVRATMHAHNHLNEMTSRDRLLLAVPLFHCYGQNSLMNAGLNVGATIILQRGFDLNESKRLIADYQVTKLFGVPTTFQLMCDYCEPADLASVGYYFSAAAKLPAQLGERWRARFGAPIHEGYGLTETAPFATYNHRIKFVPGSVGTPVDLVEVKVVDPETGALCPPGTPGEIAIRGPNVMLGYWNRPAETADAIRDGWFHSGDIGQLDQQGFLYIVDRVKDMIAIGGLKVFPAEVERVLLDHPRVSEAAVVGVPDDVWGEKGVAFLVAKSGCEITPAEIQAHCRQHLAPYKIPASVVLVESLPRNPAGKVLKTVLREQVPHEPQRPPVRSPTTTISPTADSAPSQPGRQAFESSAASDPPELLTRLKAAHRASRPRIVIGYLQEEIRWVLGAEEAPEPDTVIMETGMDSLMVVDLRDRLQQQVGSQVELVATLVFEYPRVSELANYLLETLALDGSLAATNEAASPPAKPAAASVCGMTHQNLQQQIEAMSDEQAEAALWRELSDDESGSPSP